MSRYTLTASRIAWPSVAPRLLATRFRSNTRKPVNRTAATAEMPMYSNGNWTKMPTTEATTTPISPTSKMPPRPDRSRLVVYPYAPAASVTAAVVAAALNTAPPRPCATYASRINPSAKPSNVAKPYSSARFHGARSRKNCSAISVPKLPTMDRRNAPGPSERPMTAPPAVNRNANPSRPMTLPRTAGRSARATSVR